MTQEEKAKAYDRVSKEVKDFFEGRQKMYSDVTQTLEYLFPELKESKDEKIRKDIIGYIKGISKNEVCEETKDSWIAWLEKQKTSKEALQYLRENHSSSEISDFQAAMNIAVAKAYDKGYNDGLEKQGEQKPTDKPKFKVGDWITDGEKVWKIGYIEDDMYIEHRGTISGGGAIESIDKHYHLWTIQDAKDGDVVANDHHILILRELGYSWAANGNPDSLYAYCGIKPNGNFELEQKGYCFCGTLHTHPATKEQRDTLMKSMADAGYTFDFEKKELKKIEQKPSEWSEDDETMITDLSVIVHTYFSEISGIPFKYDLSEDKIRTWLKSLKDRALTQPKLEWNEEDEDILNTIINHFEIDLECTENDDIIRWLKSLRPQNKWKPSDEQMKVLKELVEDNNQRYFYTLLRSLYDQLKILKGE